MAVGVAPRFHGFDPFEKKTYNSQPASSMAIRWSTRTFSERCFRMSWMSFSGLNLTVTVPIGACSSTAMYPEATPGLSLSSRKFSGFGCIPINGPSK